MWLLSEINLKSEEDEFKRYKNPKKEMAAAKKGKTKTCKIFEGSLRRLMRLISSMGGEGIQTKTAELQERSSKEDAKGQEGTPLSAKESS